LTSLTGTGCNSIKLRFFVLFGLTSPSGGAP
jgi:hypothetical protein